MESGVKDGCQLLLDGRGVRVDGYENGNFVGPTVLHMVQVGGLCTSKFYDHYFCNPTVNHAHDIDYDLILCIKLYVYKCLHCAWFAELKIVLRNTS